MEKLKIKDIRRVQIIKAALEIIGQGGFEGLTLEKTASKGGFSKGIVSYYFRNKKNLILQSFKFFLEFYMQKISSSITKDMTAMEMFDCILEAVLLPLESNTEQNIREKPEDILQALSFDLPLKLQAQLFLHFYSQAMLDKDFHRVVQDMYSQYFHSIVELIEYGIQKGEFKEVDVQEAAYEIMAMMEGVVTYHLMGFNPFKQRKMRDFCRQFIQERLLKVSWTKKWGA
jgi:TetR/AcrR family transcriptional repressor of bet genes